MQCQNDIKNSITKNIVDVWNKQKFIHTIILEKWKIIQMKKIIPKYLQLK